MYPRCVINLQQQHWDTLPTDRNNISQIKHCKLLPEVTHVVPNGDVFVLNRNISLDSCIASHQSKLMQQQLFILQMCIHPLIFILCVCQLIQNKVTCQV